MKIKKLSEYTLFAEAWALVAFARLTLLFIPFKNIAKMLGRAMYEPADLPGKSTAIQDNIGKAITRAAARSPWRAKCFEQAIAAKIMLKIRGIKSTVYFGIYKKSPNEMEAHAWVKSNAIIVAGGRGIDRFTVISWFGS